MKQVILAAKRSAIGTFLGGFRDMDAVTLGTEVAKAVTADFIASDFADVIVGNVLQAGQGINPGRQIALRAGLPIEVPGQTINRVCGSGMQSILSALQGIRAGDGLLYLAGGVESMSRAPHLLSNMRAGQKMGNVPLVDSMLLDGLTDPTHHYHMGMTAENIAQRWNISREQQDRFALESHRRAAHARDAGHFAQEIVGIEVKRRDGNFLMTADEGIRDNTSLESLAKLRPVFKTDGGSVTAGNSSGLNDGAAMLVIADAEYADAKEYEPLAEVVSYACVGMDPAIMGMGPASAIPIALERAHLAIDEIALFELNEAFAVQSLAVCRELNLSMDRVNISGGAVALGHPIGASGSRVVVSLIHALRRTDQRYGVASLCIGGGMGIAIVLKNESCEQKP